MAKKRCDVCHTREEIVLTRHHYTPQEREILNKPKGRKWINRCANCHMAFNKLGAEKFYEPGDYYDTHHPKARARVRRFLL